MTVKVVSINVHGHRIDLAAYGEKFIGDDDYLAFGDGEDVTMKWDGSKLEILPVLNDTGAINIGDGTTDIDFKVFLGTTSDYADFNVGNLNINLQAATIVARTFLTVQVTDTATTGTVCVQKIQLNTSGTGGTYNIGQWIDFTIGGNVTNAHPIYMYLGNIDDKTISNYIGIYMYQEDIGNAVSNFAMLSLETNMESSGGGTGEHCFIRFREHDTMVVDSAILRLEGHAAEHLVQFDGSPGTEDGAGLFDMASCGESGDCRFKVQVPAGGGGSMVDRYIYLYPV